MLKTTIYSVAIATFAFTSGASAVSVQNQLVQKSSSISNNLLAQYNFPRQYNPRLIQVPRQYYPQRQYNPGSSNPQGGQSNPQNPQGGQSNPQNPQGGQSNPQSGQSDSKSASIEQAVFEQINQYRQSQNLPALTRNTSIDQQARTHSQNMASGQVPFSHQGFDQRVQALNMPHKSASENVAYNQDKDSATRAVQSWLQSSGHLTNIRSNANLTGVGVAVNPQGVVYLTQIFVLS